MLRTRELRDGWELAESDPGQGVELDELARLSWQPARVPGTVAGAVGRTGVDPDTRDWWFRTRFEAPSLAPGDRLVLCLDGLATLSEVYVNSTHVLSGRSMFAAHEVDLSSFAGDECELLICCRALTPELAVRRRPRARWRTALVDGNLRFFRTMLIGRAPSFAPGPAVVGPWRPVRLEHRAGITLDAVRLRPRVDVDGTGVLALRIHGRAPRADAAPKTLAVVVSNAAGDTDELTFQLTPDGEGFTGAGLVQIPAVQRWWPHTHGTPALYDVTISDSDCELHHSRVGFRTLEWPEDWEESGLSLRLNGADVFARGGVWTPLDVTAPHQPEAVVRAALEQLVAAGMNMVRIPGIGCYESDAFHNLCDELGILVWQDFMLANLDYPAGQPEWDTEFETEVREQLARIAGRPSLTVLCGGSEVAQQIAMLGLDPALVRGSLYTETLPRLIDEADADVPYAPNSPWGGTLPFRPDCGVANYYGVGAYLRELSDARLACVKFSGECLAFSNVPDVETLDLIDAPGGLVPHHPAWKAGVPRDAGAGWDFEDVRDHYLRLLYGQDPVALRWVDVPRYLELSRAVTGEVMAEVFGEWRRKQSPCAGGLVLWLKDLQPGAGWGLIDSTGRPKVAYHHLRRALAPVSVWITDEGLSGMAAHVANDGPEQLVATLRVSLYKDSETCIEQGSVAVELPAHGTAAYDIDAIIGRFTDVALAYHFGPPNHNVVAASLELGPEPGAGLISNAFRYPAGRPATPDTAARLGLEASLEVGEITRLYLRSRRLLAGVRVSAPGWIAADDAFTLEPGVARFVNLAPHPQGETSDPAVSLTAINMVDRIRVNARPA